jgi:POT family proton-dependent oligopeptide transporter
MAHMAKKIEPNTVIKFGIGFLFLAAFMCSTILGFADARFNLFKCFTLAYLVITFGAIPISDRLVYYDVIKKDYLG